MTKEQRITPRIYYEIRRKLDRKSATWTKSECCMWSFYELLEQLEKGAKVKNIKKKGKTKLVIEFDNIK